MLLLQLECHRIGTGLAVLEPSCGLGKMVSVFRNPGLLKIHADKSCRHEGLPVVRKRPMKPDELRCEMGPRRTRAFLRLKVRKAPAITYLFAGFRHGCPVLWKTRMGEHQHGHPVSFQDAVAVAIITNLNPPVISHAGPEISGFFKLAVAHRSFSCMPLFGDTTGQESPEFFFGNTPYWP